MIDFYGGIESIFPNTASVESNFSILGWKKDEFRLSLTDLSLEGIMHCKQYKALLSFYLGITGSGFEVKGVCGY